MTLPENRPIRTRRRLGCSRIRDIGAHRRPASRRGRERTRNLIFSAWVLNHEGFGRQIIWRIKAPSLGVGRVGQLMSIRVGYGSRPMTFPAGAQGLDPGSVQVLNVISIAPRPSGESVADVQFTRDPPSTTLPTLPR